ncbi:MAG TPA: thioredoxin family protein [Candidatus Acidoferrales bacterium]|nr:thioredoxin family protein [Candidatus Acidoferrales bacterium]
MKPARAVFFVVLMMSWPLPARAQSGFEPLDRWKAAIVANNQTALLAFYSTAPPAQNQTPQGKTQNASEEPLFWSAVAAQGLSDFEPKVLEIERPQPGVVSLVLRIEFKLKTSSGVQPFVVEAAEAWVQQGSEWRIFATQRSDPEPNPPRRLPEPAKPNTDLYPPPEEAQAEINAALASAATDHKRVILVFGGNWCYDCHVLDATFHSKAIAPLVNANFHVVHVNIGEEYDKNLDLAAKYQVPLKKGVPALVVLDSDGKLVYSQKQGEFENSTRIGPSDVTSFLKKWAPPRQS